MARVRDTIGTQDPDQARPAPRYLAIETVLAQAIAAGTLRPGTVLTEEPVARIVGTSRTPVRKALAELMDRGVLARFDGRGFVVAGAAPHRPRVTRAMLGLDGAPPPEPPPVSAERIARAFEGVLAGALPFGCWRINEQAAADHYGVSRTVIRELLSRLQDRGILRKDPRSHWLIGPLTARDVAHYFAVRCRLEPLALRESAPLTPGREIEAMVQRLEAGLALGDDLTPEVFEALEGDLHAHLLARCPNPHLLRMIRQSQLALIVNQVFATVVGARSFQAAFREHAMVFEYLKRGSHDMAAQALEEHLRLSAARTRQRLMALAVFPQPEMPGYLVQVVE